MKLIDNARRHWHRLWSVRLSIAAAVSAIASIAATILPLWNGVFDARLLATVSAAFATAAVIARLVKQEALQDRDEKNQGEHHDEHC